MNLWNDRQIRRYVVALSLLVLIALGSYMTLRFLLGMNMGSAGEVRVSSRQEMLAQRVALYALWYTTAVDEPDRLATRQELTEAINLFEQSHSALTTGGTVPGWGEDAAEIILPGNPSTAVAALYFQAPGLVDPQVRNYIAATRSLLALPPDQLSPTHPDALYIINQGSGRLLDSLSTVSDTYYQENEIIYSFFTVVVLATLIITLGAIALEAAFIFRPMVIEVRQQRQSLQESNNQLAQQTQQLNAQARGLALANEVGSVIGRIRDSEELLGKAVELIRERFDLYYVQVYLADAAGRTLSLQAGTGSAGQELTKRGHRLPIGPGSINGLASRDRRPVLIDNTAESMELFRPNPLLPETRTELAIPMVVGERLVGVLDLQNDKAYSLQRRDLPAFEVLAGQLAIAIENANLFTQVIQTQADFETQARRLSRTNWQDYLDNVADPSRLRYSYSMESPQGTTAVEQGQTIHNALYTTPINVVNQQIGLLQIETDPNQPWSEADHSFIQAVAARVGQQIENLRLIEQAERYRAEAEQAVRRLTRTGWQDYLHQQDQIPSNGFQFNGQEITPLAHQSVVIPNDQQKISQPLAVRGQTIGNLELLVNEANPETKSILSTIATRLSNHIENLRLAEQTERALGEAQLRSEELAIINSTVATVTRARNVAEGLEEVLDPLLLVLGVRQARIALIDEERTQLRITAERYDFAYSGSALDTILPLKENRLMEEIFAQKRAIWIPDTATDPRLEGFRDIIFGQSIQAMAVLPILIDEKVVGTLGIDCLPGDPPLTANQLELAETILLQAGTAIQNLQLSERAQRRANELALLNNLARVFAQQLNEEELLDEAVNQMEHIFQFDSCYVGLLDPKTQMLRLPIVYDLGKRSYNLPPLPLDGQNYSSRVFTSKSPLLVHLTPEEHAALKESQRNLLGENDEPTASMLFVPMLLGGDMVGIITIQSNAFNVYDQNDVNVLSGVANNFVVAWQNTQLYQQAERRAQRERLVNEIGQKIQGTASMEKAIETALRELGEALQVRASRVTLLDVAETPEKGQTGPLAQTGLLGRKG